MVDYLLDWLHNLFVTLAALAGIGLFAYVGLREFSPGTLYTAQRLLDAAGFWIARIDLWPVVALMATVFMVGSTLPHRESRW